MSRLFVHNNSIGPYQQGKLPQTLVKNSTEIAKCNVIFVVFLKLFLQDLRQVYQNRSEHHLTIFCINLIVVYYINQSFVKGATVHTIINSDLLTPQDLKQIIVYNGFASKQTQEFQPHIPNHSSTIGLQYFFMTMNSSGSYFFYYDYFKGGAILFKFVW